MDHNSARFIEFPNGSTENIVIESQFPKETKQDALTKSENLMHNKEQQKQTAYYKEIGEVIKNYNEVLLFGPTDARLELFNTLKANHHFENIKIEVQSADKMTDTQQRNFVKNYFSNTIKK